ncbi:hepatic triacylglycerol lipase [Rhinophrynus dorsalis]
MGRFQLLPLLLIFLLSNQTWAQKRKEKCSLEEHYKAMRIKKDQDTPRTKFKLYKEGIEEDLCKILTLQPETLEQCSFNASLPLVIIVHGWSVEGILEEWIWKMAEAFSLRRKQINVIIADWLPSANVHYPIAAQNSRIIGLEIAEFLEWLESSIQFPRSNVHLIGYSLGAHVSGFAGSYISGSSKIGRITGLDPAGPLFEGMSPLDRLSPDDAGFVDVIHTFTQQHMGLSIGINQPVGHYDFYPNGGHFQPGCHIKYIYNHIANFGIHGFKETVKCAHERSVHLFIDSILNDDKQSMAYWCKDINTFNKGMCLSCRKNRCNTLGYNIKKPRLQNGRKLFLKTRSLMPYKVYHYQFKIHFINQIEDKQLEPIFTVSLTGTEEEAENVLVTPVDGIKGNKTYSFLITLDTDIGDLLIIKIKWEGNIWDSFQTLMYWTTEENRPGLLVKTIRVKAGETQKKMMFCSETVDNVKLLPGQEKTYVKCMDSSRNQERKT